MPRHSLDQVRAALLRAGFPPRHVNRYVRELREHLTDLVSRERNAGLSVGEAEARARALLGTDAELVQAMIDRGAPRSLAAKAPWAAFGILPLAILIVTTGLLARWSMGFFLPYSTLSAADVPENVRAIGTILSLIGSYVIGPALAALCIIIALRQRLCSRWVWAGLALIALVCGPFGLHIQFPAPDGDLTGGIRGSVVAATNLTMMGIRSAALFALSALVYRILKQRVERSHA